jgi:hypothetical protein
VRISISESFKWFNRHGAPLMFLLLLLGAAAFANLMARIRMDMADRQFVLMDDSTVRDMRVIDFLNDRPWIVFAYITLSLACFLWLKLRDTPRSTVWATFIVLALPVLIYGSACLHIGNKVILWPTAKG